jgi:hypothetical protein
VSGRRSLPIREDLDPAVRFVLTQIRERKTAEHTFWRVEAGAGLGTHAVRMWRYGKMTKGPPYHYYPRGA